MSSYQREFIYDQHEIREGMQGRLRRYDQIRDFALAGNAYFTIRSAVTGTRFTYRVRRRDDGRGTIWFVSVLTGPGHYEYIGQIRGPTCGSVPAYDHGRRARISWRAPGAYGFAWFWHQMRLQTHGGLSKLEVWHEGRCGRCGRRLTVPESVGRGIGPECIKYVGEGA
jgi:hypothetical protein